VDRVTTIDTLAPDDCYDLVFVAVQAGQLPDVLPQLADVLRVLRLCGQRPPLRWRSMQADAAPGGTRSRRVFLEAAADTGDVDKVVSAHVGVDMTVGGATAPLSGVFRYRLKTAFEGAKYKLNFVSDMDAWLKCHIALILPACYLCSSRPRRASRGRRRRDGPAGSCRWPAAWRPSRGQMPSWDIMRKKTAKTRR